MIVQFLGAIGGNQHKCSRALADKLIEYGLLVGHEELGYILPRIGTMQRGEDAWVSIAFSGAQMPKVMKLYEDLGGYDSSNPVHSSLDLQEQGYFGWSIAHLQMTQALYETLFPKNFQEDVLAALQDKVAGKHTYHRV